MAEAHPNPPAAARPESRPESIRWTAYREIYLDILEARNPGEHARNVRRVLSRFTQYRGLAGKHLAEITQLDLELYVAARRRDTYRDKPLAPRTINNEIQALNTCFAKAGPKAPRGPARKNFGFLEEPPWVEPLEEYRREVRIVEPWQIEAYIDATRLAKAPRTKGCDPQRFWVAALLLAMVTGLRRSALLKIPRPADATLLGRGELFLPAEMNKTKADLRISLGSSPVVEFIAGLPSAVGEPLLPWRNRRGKPMSLGYFSNSMAAFQRAAGIPDDQRVSPQKLRATAATETADLFGDAIAKKKLGHSPNTNTLNTHYKALRPSELDRKASEHLAGLVMPYVGPPAATLLDPRPVEPDPDDGPHIIRFPGRPA